MLVCLFVCFLAFGRACNDMIFYGRGDNNGLLLTLFAFKGQFVLLGVMKLRMICFLWVK